MCRDDDVNIRPRSTHHRYILLRRLSRRKNAPTKLRKTVERLRRLESDERGRRREYRAFRRECAPALKELEKMQQSIRSMHKRIYSTRCSIGRIVHPNIRIPLVNDARTEADDYEFVSSYDSDDE